MEIPMKKWYTAAIDAAQKHGDQAPKHGEALGKHTVRDSLIEQSSAGIQFAQ